jgi:type IV pilus assembly protein PilB
MASEKRGDVLLATPPHAGRTTLMYSIVRMHDAYTQNVQTVEIETQGTIEGVRQNKFDPLQEGGPSYATFVRSLLRRDPDVLAIADLPDAETAQEAARVDPDRARVYVCLKADNALQAIQVWCKAVGDLELAAQSLHGVVVERLVRRLCTNCRVPYQPSKEMLAKLGLPADKVQQLFKKGGQVVVKSNKPEICPVCSGVGYYGQIGLFEVYSIGDEERAAIRAGDLNAARAELRKRQLPIMHQAALRRAVEGVTSIEEITRVTAEEKKTASAPAAAAPAASPA